MKKILLFIPVIIFLFNCGGTPTTPGTQCSGGNEICFDFQGSNYSSHGIPGYGSSSFYRLKNTGSATYIKMDIQSSTPTVASYSVNSASGFIITQGSDNYVGSSGTIDITSVNNNLIFGKFTVNVKHNNFGAEIPVTNGIIDGIACP